LIKKADPEENLKVTVPVPYHMKSTTLVRKL
jgi:hypothetical protein